MRRYRAVLRHRDLRRLLLAFVIDACGTWASAVVLTAWVFEAKGSLVWLALLAATRWIPGLIAAPFAGVIADRFDRRTILMVSATANGLLMSGIAIVVAVDSSPALVLGLLTLSSLAGSPYRPAAGALPPDLVEDAELATANSLLAALENVVVVIGPVLGAALLLLHLPAVGVAINAASFFVAAGIAASLRVRSRGAGARGGDALRQIAAGATALRAAPTAGVLLAFAAIDTLLAWAYGVVYLPLSEHLGLGTGGYGLLLTAAAVGGILGAIVAGRLAARTRIAPVIVGGIAVQALPYALTAFTTNPVLCVGLQVVSGAGMVVVEVLTLVAVQREVPIGRLSSVLGLLDLTTLAASAIGSFAASGVLTALPIETALLVLGLGDTVLALLLAPLLFGTDRRAGRRTAALAGRVAVLQGLPLFAQLPPPRLEALAETATITRIDAGECLIDEGDTADALWILAAGTLAVSSAATRRSGAMIPDVVAPDVVGEIGVLRGLPRTASVTAATPSVVWRITADDYLDSLSAQRVPRMMLGAPNLRLRRTDPDLVAEPDLA